ncbi:MAG TPA: AI-2E family transporter [Bryobacteraceae bacterium]|nr:AI-2E family transporter [Bryobacteraceae bacterium]
MAILSKPLLAAEREVRNISIPLIALGVVIAILYFGRVFFITSLAAVMLAFILEPFVNLLVRIRLPRSLASFLVCAAALSLLYLIGLGAYTQGSILLEDLPKYSQRIGELIESVSDKAEGLEQRTYQLVLPRQKQPVAPPPQETSRKKRRTAEPPPPAVPGVIPEVRIHQESSPLKDFISARLGSFYQIVLMASFVPFLVYFMLSWHDHIHRSFLQFFQGEDRAAAARSLQGIADMVRAFVVGNSVLGLLLAASSSLAFWILHLPYALLVGPLSGFLSLVPYVGLPLAALPPLFVALTAYNTISGYLLVIAIVSVLHLLALNLLYPKFVGSRVHLNPLAVTFSLMVWGFLWDAAGLLLAIPMTAAFKAVCDNVKGLRPIGKFLGD